MNDENEVIVCTLWDKRMIKDIKKKLKNKRHPDDVGWMILTEKGESVSCESFTTSLNPRDDDDALFNDDFYETIDGIREQGNTPIIIQSFYDLDNTTYRQLELVCSGSAQRCFLEREDFDEQESDFGHSLN